MGHWYCFDGCYEATGIDRRTCDGQPAWLQARIKGRFAGKAWSIKRLKPEYKHYAR